VNIEFINESYPILLPKTYQAIKSQSAAIGFNMQSDIATGTLLQSLAASRPGGRLLELGTGLGLSTCWLLESMDQQASLPGCCFVPR
jgi:predicted O-methyltransferase YrrM